MSKVDDVIKKHKKANYFGMPVAEFFYELGNDLEEIRTEQEELQKKADKYDELSKHLEFTARSFEEQQAILRKQNKPVEVPECFDKEYKAHGYLKGNKSEMLNTALGGIYRTGFQGQFENLDEDIFKKGIEWNGWSAETILWATRNYADFCMAVITGNYTVKQHQLYYVKLTEKEYLCYDIDEDEYFSDSVDEADGYKMKFTESEIKAIDERYWPFAVKVEEEMK